jgi:hypothetical protein
MANQPTQTSSTDTSKQEATSKPKDGSTAQAGKTQNEVDETAKQTFPASDAPASWAGKDIAPQDRKDAQKKA